MSQSNAPAPDSDDDTPPRSRDADLVEEARIARAGGGILHVSTVFQALCYLVLVGGLAIVIWRMVR